MKKLLSLVISVLLVFSLFSFVSGSVVKADDSPHFYQIRTVGVMPDDYVGAFALETANTYENDFKSNFSYPMQGMTFTPGGDLVVCDTSYGRIHILGKDLQNKLTFGELGKGDGKLQYPADVAVDSDGNFYVADFFNNYWAKFDKTGKWIMNVGTEGSDDGQFNGPSGIAVDKDGNVYVSDQLNGRIEVFDKTGKFTKSITDDSISYPGGMTMDNEGNLLVVGMKNCVVDKFDKTGKLISSFGAQGGGDGQFVYPFDVTTDSKGNIYVVDRGLGKPMHPIIEKFDSKGKFIMNIGSRAKKIPQSNGSFITPAGVAVDNDGKVYVIDAGYFHEVGNPFGYPAGVRITVFDKDGSYLAKKDFDINAEGRLMNSWGACQDSQGKVWVTSWNNFSDAGMIEIFDKSGKYLKSIKGISDKEPFTAMGGIISDGKGNIFVGLGEYIAQFDENGNFVKKIGAGGKVSNVYQLAIDPDGNLWCASNGTQTIVGFKPDGTFLKQFTTRHAPTGLAIGKDGNFYCTSVDDNKVYVYTDKGKFKRAFGRSGRQEGEFWIPYGLAIAEDGSILVADTENGRIQAFDGKTYRLLWSTPRAYYEPTFMTWGSDGNLYVGDCFHSVVRVLSTKPPHISNFSFVVKSSVSKVEVKAGGSTTFNIIIKNTGKTDDSYTLSLDTSNLPEGWTISPVPESVDVKAGDQAIIPVTATTTSGSPPEESGTITLSVISKGDSTLKKTLDIIIVIPKAPPVGVTFKGNKVPLNDITTLDVVTEHVSDLYGIALTIQYDPNAVEVEKVEAGGILGSNAIFLENHSKPGTIIIGYTLKSSVSGITGAGSLVKLTLKGLKVGSTNLQISDLSFVDSKNKSISTEATNITAEVYDTTPPKITVDFSDGETVDTSSFYFAGETEPGCKVTVNGKSVTVSANGGFTGSVYLDEGSNTIVIISTNNYGVTNKITKTVILQTSTIITLQPDNPMMTVNGVQKEIDPGRGTKPVIIKEWGRTVVPIRAIVEALGGTIGWDGTERKVTINLKDTVIELWIGKPKAKVNGIEKWIDPNNHNVKPIIVNQRTMLPLRFVAESLGAKVDWDASTKTITITYPAP